MDTCTLCAVLLGWLVLVGAWVWVMPFAAASAILAAAMTIYVVHLVRVARQSTNNRQGGV